MLSQLVGSRPIPATKQPKDVSLCSALRGNALCASVLLRALTGATLWLLLDAVS